MWTIDDLVADYVSYTLVTSDQFISLDVLDRKNKVTVYPVKHCQAVCVIFMQDNKTSITFICYQKV